MSDSSLSVLLIIVGGVWTALLGAGTKFLFDLSKSVQELNQKMAIVFTKIEAHDDSIDDLGERVREIELGGMQ